MTSIFSDGALHPGRDANDAWWIVVRREEDWGTDPRPPGDYHTRFDAGRNVLELAPLPLGEASLAPPEVSAEDGTRYVLDAIRHLVLRQRPCDAEPRPLPGIGGHGWITGRFSNPAAIAIDERGWIYVVDRGNHRVQVIDPGGPDGGSLEARVVIVLGGVDSWGRPVAGSEGGLLDDPIAIAVGKDRIWVAGKTGWMQTYDRRFRRGPRFMALRPGASTADIVAIAADGDGVVVAEAGWSRLTRFDCRGTFTGELGADEAPAGLADAMGRARFELEGTRVVGPIDGGLDGLAWHQVIVDAVLPPGTSIEVQTWAADAIALPPPASSGVPTLPAVPPWAPELPVALPASHEPDRGEIARPVMSDTSAWERWRHAPYLRGATFALAGTGPNASLTFTAPWDVAARLRAADQLVLRSATANAPATIASISARSVSLIASGDRVNYPAGTELWLLERDGRAIDAARIGTTPAAINLLPILVDGGGADITWPHAAAALIRRGDRLELRNGGDLATVDIQAIALDPATVTLTALIAGNFSTCRLELVEAAGRLVLEHAEGWGQGFPAGGTIDVAYLVGATPANAVATVTWSDPALATVWTAVPVPGTWISIAPAVEPGATDRGRYLWVKLRLRGTRRHPADVAATATPLVRSLRLLGPRLSYLSYLPAVFGRRDADTPTGAVFLERFLALFEGRLTQIESRYELVARMLNPLAADDDWLDFIAGWFDLVLDPTWPRARRARLLMQIFELYRLRGTREGILRMVEAYTGQRPELIEGFQIRPRAGMVLGCAGVLGCAPLGGMDVDAAAAEELLGMYAHRFTLVAYADDGCDLELFELALRALVDSIKPAHTDVDLRVALPHGRIGLESMVGLDFILGDDRRRDTPLGTIAAASHPAPILGVDARLLSTSPFPGATPPLDESGAPPIGSFTIR